MFDYKYIYNQKSLFDVNNSLHSFPDQGSTTTMTKGIRELALDKRDRFFSDPAFRYILNFKTFKKNNN